MAFDGSELLGAAEVAGVLVNPLGTFKRQISSGKGAGDIRAGGLVWRRVLTNKIKDEQATLEASATPSFVGQGHLAVTETDVALLRLESGKLGGHRRLTEVLARVALSEVDVVDLGKVGGPGFSMPLTIRFRDGSRWVVELARLNRRAGDEVLAALTGAGAPV